MKHIVIVIFLFSTVFLSACNSIKVPKSTMSHTMSATPTNVVPTKSEWKIEDHPQANKEIPISILIKDKSDKRIQSFETVHEKKMHLFIVSKDLAYFSHIHPKYHGNGEFDITETFPSGGDYKVIAEFTPKGGGDSSVESHWLHIDGEPAKEEPLIPDKEFTKVVDGKKVSLTFSQLAAGKTIHMTFTINDAATNKPIKNLQPYLGAMGHTVAMSADAEKYLHIHPMTTSGNGPNIIFMTIFPEKGVYKVWGQFKYEGKVFTVPFVVNVP
ncbi:hypothetical protein BACCIP111895_04449 [Neobacillus rhizosphaerae]|uniref:YtkA-like domain-containing protein n=1 Tax=Neobacillus rhizosphaerae TaxID=2880965 RepID=A0ABM9EX75_9BACI|nr:hypothetical protein [Neobacillus rhizosphaerae]CAH2717259.1 hypothetical protein BACCIP111895_04449 [Neobacillus rhizosphaerae]